MGNLESARMFPITCKGSYALGSACGACERCVKERAFLGTFVTHEEAVAHYNKAVPTDLVQAVPTDLVQAVRELINGKYPYLVPEFLEAMNDIGEHGFKKYGDASFHAHRLARSGRAGMTNRTDHNSYLQHAKVHIEDYKHAVPHDHFNTAIHQLAASAFNLMMEAYFIAAEQARAGK